jgi:cell division protein FtsQ
LRSGNLFSKRDATGFDTPEQSRVPARVKSRKGGAAVAEMPLRRDFAYSDGYSDEYDDVEQDGEFARTRMTGVRLSFSSKLLPKTLWGRIAAGGGLVLVAGVGIAALLMTRSFLLKDEHFKVEGPSSIQIAGNSQMTRPQLLSVFGEDVERNIFNIPLGERRAELESLPWVAHATVMRLLPNRVRVAIVERTPVAFVRQGKEIGLVDANGVLLDMSRPVDADGTAARKAPGYSFPVLTGILAGEPLSTRAARMRIYMEFVGALDAGGENISRKLSEVDLSNPEDVKAIVPDRGVSGGTAGDDILVHFGDGKFLERYHQYQQHLAEWRAQYPKLASVDMRYQQQVVLEMQPGSVVPSGAPAVAAKAPVVAGGQTGAVSTKPVVKSETIAAKAVVTKTAAAKPGAAVPVAPAPAPAAMKAPVVVSSAVKTPVVVHSPPVAASVLTPARTVHLTTSFDVGPGVPRQARGAVKAAGKGSAATPLAQGAAQ